MAYKYKLWASLKYAIGAMTNDVEQVESKLDDEERDTLNFFGVAITLPKALRKTPPLLWRHWNDGLQNGTIN